MRRLFLLSRPAWYFLMLVLFVSGSSFIWATRFQQTLDVGQTPFEGNTAALSTKPAPLAKYLAPDFTLTDLEGTTIQMSDLTGGLGQRLGDMVRSLSR